MCSSGVCLDYLHRCFVFLSIDRGRITHLLNWILSNVDDRLVADSQRWLLHHQCPVYFELYILRWTCIRQVLYFFLLLLLLFCVSFFLPLVLWYGHIITTVWWRHYGHNLWWKSCYGTFGKRRRNTVATMHLTSRSWTLFQIDFDSKSDHQLTRLSNSQSCGHVLVVIEIGYPVIWLERRPPFPVCFTDSYDLNKQSYQDFFFLLLILLFI